MQEGRAGAKGKIQDNGCVPDPRWSSIYAAAATGVRVQDRKLEMIFINPCGHRAHEASNSDNRKDWAHRKWETQTEREATINSKENNKVYEKGKVISTGNNRTVTRLQTLSIGLTPSCIGRMADGLAWARKTKPPQRKSNTSGNEFIKELKVPLFGDTELELGDRWIK